VDDCSANRYLHYYGSSYLDGDALMENCKMCGQPVPEDDVIDLTNDDEQELVVPQMDLVGQCDCQDEFHLREGQGDEKGRCRNEAIAENGGICTACLFGCGD
jgi:hypothetical protein